MFEKAGIFCQKCPIRTHVAGTGAELPVDIGGSAPISIDMARQNLHHNIDAVRYQTIDSEGRTVGADATVVIPAAIPAEDVRTAFEECVAPAPNSVKVLGLRLRLGNKCMALAAIDEFVHWNAASLSNERP